MNVETVIDTLEKAADVLEAGGWCRGILADGSEHCALGAINTVLWGHHCYDYSSRGQAATADVVTPVVEYLKLDPPAEYPVRVLGGAASMSSAHMPLVWWNNHGAKDGYEVIDAFRGAAKALANGEIKVTEHSNAT